MVRHRIITRGMGTQQLLVSRGYGGVFVERIVEVIQRIIVNRGGRKPKVDFEEMRVWARMVEYDNTSPTKPIEGSVSIRVKKGERTRALASLITQRLREWAVSVLRVIR